MSTATSSTSSDLTLLGDVREVVRGFPLSHFDLVVTSPPYWAQRRYTGGRDSREIGMEGTPDDYVDHLVDVFHAIKPHLKDAGSLWVNIDDTYRDGGPVLILEKLLLQMAPEWDLHNRIVWFKPDAPPESIKNRFATKYEFMYFWSKKGQKPYFDKSLTNIPVSMATVERLAYKFNRSEKHKDVLQVYEGMKGDLQEKAELYLEKGVDCGDVWIIPTNKEETEHIAPYPELLAARPILSACPEGGLVLDPFHGSGTTGVAALKLARHFVGIDVNPEAVAEANERTKQWLEGNLFLT